MGHIKQILSRLTWWDWLAAVAITLLLMYATWAMSR